MGQEMRLESRDRRLETRDQRPETANPISLISDL